MLCYHQRTSFCHFEYTVYDLKNLFLFAAVQLFWLCKALFSKAQNTLQEEDTRRRSIKGNFVKFNLVFRKLSILAILPFLSFLCFNLGKIFLFVWVVLGVQYKIIDDDTEHYLTSKVWKIVIYKKGDSPWQNMSFLC